MNDETLADNTDSADEISNYNNDTEFSGEEIPAECIFFDEGVSGSIPANNRKGFKKMLKYLESHEVNTIYLFEISRLGRTFVDTLNLVMEFEEKGIRIVSLSPSESWSTVEGAH